MKATVLIDTYNHERFIERAITSVLEQDMPLDDVEILVVDDGSTDRTPELVRRFEPRVRYLPKPNGGQASAFNFGFAQARGEIIATLDGDDWWSREKLGRVLGVLEANPEVGIVGHGIIESCYGTEKVVAVGAPVRLRLDSAWGARVFRLHRCYFGTSRMTLRAEIARKILPVPEALVFEADEYVFTLAAALTDAIILAEPLTYYRVHDQNLFLKSGGSLDGKIRKQRVLAALASELSRSLSALGVPENAAAPVLELVDAEAAQLGLMVHGGAPWRTYLVENRIYRMQHGDASWRQRLFHEVMMLPALVLPPKWFYSARQWVAGQPWYKHVRHEFIPVPGFTKVGASGQTREALNRSESHD